MQLWSVGHVQTRPRPLLLLNMTRLSIVDDLHSQIPLSLAHNAQAPLGRSLVLFCKYNCEVRLYWSIVSIGSRYDCYWYMADLKAPLGATQIIHVLLPWQ